MVAATLPWCENHRFGAGPMKVRHAVVLLIALIGLCTACAPSGQVSPQPSAPSLSTQSSATCDRVYFDPAVEQAKRDGLRALGQFIYYDAMVMHGPGSDPASFGGIRAKALRRAKPPARGGDEVAYLNAFLDARVAAMKAEEAHEDTTRVEDAQRVFVAAGNLDLNTPLVWEVYGDPYRIG